MSSEKFTELYQEYNEILRKYDSGEIPAEEARELIKELNTKAKEQNLPFLADETVIDQDTGLKEDVYEDDESSSEEYLEDSEESSEY